MKISRNFEKLRVAPPKGGRRVAPNPSIQLADCETEVTLIVHEVLLGDLAGLATEEAAGSTNAIERISRRKST
jgi:hypothetical protein